MMTHSMLFQLESTSILWLLLPLPTLPFHVFSLSNNCHCRYPLHMPKKMPPAACSIFLLPSLSLIIVQSTCSSILELINSEKLHSIFDNCILYHGVRELLDIRPFLFNCRGKLLCFCAYFDWIIRSKILSEQDGSHGVWWVDTLHKES